MLPMVMPLGWPEHVFLMMAYAIKGAVPWFLFKIRIFWLWSDFSVAQAFVGLAAASILDALDILPNVSARKFTVQWVISWLRHHVV